MASGGVQTFTDENFEQEVLKADIPVLVDFWAEWCGPCRMLTPVMEDLAAEQAGKVKIGKVDVDQNSEVATRYGIQSIPTLMLFVGGEAKESITGALPKAQILQRIASHVSAG